MNQSVYIGLGLGAGLLAATQAAINGRLRNHVGDPVWASFSSLCGSFTCAVLYMVVTRPAFPTGVPGVGAWWFWLGGPLGALFVLSGAGLVPKLGAGTFVALVVCGQLMTAMVLDHFALLGLAERSFSPGRLLGALMVIGGVALIRYF